MFDSMWRVLTASVNKVKELKFALAIPGIAAAVAIAASFVRDQADVISSVIVAVIMGVVLVISFLMMRAAANAKGETAGPYARLYIALAWLFAGLLASSACLSASSVFFNYPIDMRHPGKGVAAVNGDYRVEESVILTDLRHRVPKTSNGPDSRDVKIRTDRIVKQRDTASPYEIHTGTNGLRIEEINSATHPGMITTELPASRFAQTTMHSYISSIPADQIPFNVPTTVKWEGTYIDGFPGDKGEWTGTSTSVDTESLTMVVLFPETKLCKRARGMEQGTGNTEVPFHGVSAPVIHAGGRVVTWTIPRPVRGLGYFLAFEW